MRSESGSGRSLDVACRWLEQNPKPERAASPVPGRCVPAIEKAIADRKRQMLVAMATGTGKTVTLVNEVYRLMASRVGLRVLFLVDRRAAGGPGSPDLRVVRGEPNKKFDKIYEVYSQRFQKDELRS